MRAEFSIDAVGDGNDTPSTKGLQEARKAGGKSRRCLILGTSQEFIDLHSWK
jgi:hypothetical protein